MLISKTVDTDILLFFFEGATFSPNQKFMHSVLTLQLFYDSIIRSWVNPVLVIAVLL